MTSQKQKEKPVKDDKKKELIDTESDSLFDDSVTDSRAGPKARHKKKPKPRESVYSDAEAYGFKEAESEYSSSKDEYFEDETISTDEHTVSEQSIPGSGETGTLADDITLKSTDALKESSNTKENPDQKKAEYRKRLKKKAREKRDERNSSFQEETADTKPDEYYVLSYEEPSSKDENSSSEDEQDGDITRRRKRKDDPSDLRNIQNNISVMQDDGSFNEMRNMQENMSITQKLSNDTPKSNNQPNLSKTQKDLSVSQKSSAGTPKGNNHSDLRNTQKNLSITQQNNSGTRKSNNSTPKSNTLSSGNTSASGRNIVQRAGNTAISATSYTVGKARTTLSKATGEKDDNAGADAFGVVERAGEQAVHFGFYTAEDLITSSAKSTYQTSEYTADSMFEVAKKTATKAEAEKAAYRKKLRRKQAQIRRKAKKAEKAGKNTAKKAAEETVNVAKFIGKVILARGKIIIGIVLAILIIIIFGGQMSGSTINIVTEVASVMSMATYQSSPQMIDEADLQMSYKELMLRAEIDEIEDDYPDYDEYSYTLGSIGHDPFTLVNYLHAQFGTINSEAIAYIDTLFNEMYVLKLTPTEEIRYRLVPKPPEEDDEDEDSDDDEDDDSEDDDEDEEEDGDTDGDDEEEDDDDEEPEYILEEYTVNILKVELNTTSLESIVTARLEGDATRKAIYNILNVSHGLVQFVGSPTLTTWSVESYYGYRRNPLGDYPELHRGLDIAMPVGTSVHSAISGFVKEISSDPMYGDYIVIEDETGTTVKYAGMSHITAIVESRVHKGETIGYSGSCGSEPPCLHMELLVNGSYYNPLFYTENPQS